MSESGPQRPPAGASDPPARERRPWGSISRAQIVAAALEITRRDGLGAYPGTIDVPVTRGDHGPGALRLVETILATLADAGLDERAAVRYYLVFIDLVLGRMHREAHLREITTAEVFDTELDMLIRAVEAEAGTRR